MSCGIAIAVSLLLSDPLVAMAEARPSGIEASPLPVASEPLFADIVTRATALKVVVDTWRSSTTPPIDLAAFAAQAEALSALDLQGHLVLKARGTDGDLKCILRGISEDIPVKLAALRSAATADARGAALAELSYLLEDNVEVITAPPQPGSQSGVETH